MAKQIIVLALIIFLAAVGMAAAQAPEAAKAAAQLGPAAAAHGVNLSNPNDVLGALRGAAAANGAPLPAGTPAEQEKEKSAAAPGAAAAGAAVAGGVVGSFFFF